MLREKHIFWLNKIHRWEMKLLGFLICLFLILCRTRESFTQMEKSPLPWRAAYFVLYSAIIVIEQCWFFSLTHILWHRATVYDCHLWRPVTLKPAAERLAVELASIPFSDDLGLSLLVFQHPNFRNRGKRSNRLYHQCGVFLVDTCNTFLHGHIIKYQWTPLPYIYEIN